MVYLSAEGRSVNVAISECCYQTPRNRIRRRIYRATFRNSLSLRHQPTPTSDCIFSAHIPSRIISVDKSCSELFLRMNRSSRGMEGCHLSEAVNQLLLHDVRPLLFKQKWQPTSILLWSSAFFRELCIHSLRELSKLWSATSVIFLVQSETNVRGLLNYLLLVKFTTPQW